jgi:AcrR family transcriptional regulator
MPAPSRTSLEQIVRAGAAVLEAEGPDGLTMQAVARVVGVRAPSLYKHVDGRDALVRLIAEDAVRDLAARLGAAAPEGTDPASGMAAAARALRTFAHDRPAAFRLVFSPGADATRPDPELMRLGSATVLRVAGELAGPEHRLEAARTITAWASGFLAMELAGAFRLGGDVETAFEWGIAHLAAGLRAGAPTGGGVAVPGAGAVSRG